MSVKIATQDDKSSGLENPYLDSRNDWNEIVGREKANSAAWRMFALISSGITAFAVGGMIYAAQLPDTIPFVFKEDASGGITALGIPNTEFKVDNRVIANQLALFIEDLRQIPTSDEMRKVYVHRVKMMSTATLFRSQLSKMLKEGYANMGSGELTVDIKTILPIAKDTWEIDWVETKNGIKSGKYKAVINYDRTPMQLKNPTELIWNPIGVTVKDININQVIGG